MRGFAVGGGVTDLLWRRALIAKKKRELDELNRSTSARLALCCMLAKAGVFVGAVQVHRWTRDQQGRAYLWAYGITLGREDTPMPEFIKDES
jgi:hypothetical protein